MPGFTLGGTTGATLGGPNGGTLGTAPETWRLDGDPLAATRTTAEVATPSVLALTFRVTSRASLERFRSLKSDEGKVAVLGNDDGGHVAVDRANGANTFTLTPPDRRKPLRQERTVHVQRYEEDLVSQTVDEWDVEVEFAVNTDRTDTPSLSLREQVPDGDGGGTLGNATGFTLGGEHGTTLGSGPSIPTTWWGLETPLGTLATERVDADVVGTGADGVRRFELTVRLDKAQAHVFEAAYAKLRGSRVKQIPDAPNEMRDEVGGDVTVTVDAPDGQDAVSDGDYVVTEWESTRMNDRFQSVDVTIAEK